MAFGHSPCPGRLSVQHPGQDPEQDPGQDPEQGRGSAAGIDSCSKSPPGLWGLARHERSFSGIFLAHGPNTRKPAKGQGGGALIELDAVAKTYGGTPAVTDVSLKIYPGETVCLLGSSGCGKTTTLKLINRLLRPSGGCVRFRGQDTAGIDATLLRRQMGYVIQGGALFPHKTVAGNIGLLCKLAGGPRPACMTGC